MSPDELSFSAAALRLLTGGYAPEPGVRLLDDRIDTLCRRAVRLRADGSSPPGEMKPETVARWLGAPRFRDEELAGRTRRPGVALGLGVTARGGDVLVVEAARLPGGGALRVTGTVGPKLTESAQVALTWVRANADRFGALHAGFNDATDLHVHLPDAGWSKDGASAGVTLAVAIVSTLTAQPVRGDVAMTGELTLGGQVEPVAGIREKVLGACRARMATVILPAANEPDVGETFPGGLPYGISVRYAETMDQVLKVALPEHRGVARTRPLPCSGAPETPRVLSSHRTTAPFFCSTQTQSFLPYGRHRVSSISCSLQKATNTSLRNSLPLLVSIASSGAPRSRSTASTTRSCTRCDGGGGAPRPPPQSLHACGH